MPQYDNRNRGSLWINRDKQTPSHPDMSGTINLGGQDWKVAIWKKRGDATARAPDYSLAFTPMQAESDWEPAERPAPATRGNGEFDDPIPF